MSSIVIHTDCCIVGGVPAVVVLSLGQQYAKFIAYLIGFGLQPARLDK